MLNADQKEMNRTDKKKYENANFFSRQFFFNLVSPERPMLNKYKY